MSNAKDLIEAMVVGGKSPIDLVEVSSQKKFVYTVTITATHVDDNLKPLPFPSGFNERKLKSAIEEHIGDFLFDTMEEITDNFTDKTIDGLTLNPHIKAR